MYASDLNVAVDISSNTHERVSETLQRYQKSLSLETLSYSSKLSILTAFSNSFIIVFISSSTSSTISSSFKVFSSLVSIYSSHQNPLPFPLASCCSSKKQSVTSLFYKDRDITTVFVFAGFNYVSNNIILLGLIFQDLILFNSLFSFSFFILSILLFINDYCQLYFLIFKISLGFLPF